MTSTPIKVMRLHATIFVPGAGIAAIWRMLDGRLFPWCVNVPGRGTRSFGTLKEAAAVWKTFIRAPHRTAPIL